MKKLILIHDENYDFLMNFCVKFTSHIKEPGICMLALLLEPTNPMTKLDMANSLYKVAKAICLDVRAERVFITNTKLATEAVEELHDLFNVFNIYVAPAANPVGNHTIINDLDDVDYAFMRCISWVFDV